MNTVGTVEDLRASATRRTGLTDFGTDDYADGLAVLLDSYDREAALTPPGAKAQRAFLRGALAGRLCSEAAWRAHPEYAQVQIDKPIFVTGLPRTGTTALHRLLTADPGSQGLEMWLVQVPQPRPPRHTWADNPVFQHIQAVFAQHHEEHPEFMGVHYMAADQVEECWQLLQQSMRSISFETLAHVPGYSAWLRGQDWTGAYLRHRRNLQMIGMHDAGSRKSSVQCASSTRSEAGVYDPTQSTRSLAHVCGEGQCRNHCDAIDTGGHHGGGVGRIDAGNRPDRKLWCASADHRENAL